jgi:autotransporter-associated beta strand protein
MNQSQVKRVLLTAAGAAVFSLAANAGAQIVVDGSRDTGYGSALAVQTCQSGFGTSNQLDAAYANVSNNTLYIFLAGNLSDGNHVNLYIQDSAPGGQNTLNISSGGGLPGNNGLTLPAGFNPTYALDVNPSGGNLYVDQYALTGSTSHNYLGFAPLSGGTGSNTSLIGGVSVGFNDTNAGGVGGNGGNPADQGAAAAVSTGLEFGIPLSAFNFSGGSIQFMADITNGQENFLSNQFLPALPSNYGNLATPSSTNLQTDGASITPLSVTVPIPTGTWLLSTGGSWNNSPNWAGGIPNSPGAAAIFGSLSGASTVTLDTAITVGTISLNSGNSYNISAGTGGVLTMNNNGSTATITDFGGTHTLSAPVVLVSNTSFVVVNHGDGITVAGNINGSGGLIATGPGGSVASLTLSGSNTYTGGTDVENGNLTLGSSSALPTGTALILSAKDLPAGVLDLNANSATLGSILVTTGPQTVGTGATAAIINTASSGSSTLTYAGNASNPSNFTGYITDGNASGGAATTLLVTGGSLTLSHGNSYSGGTNVTGGILTVAASSALPIGGNLIVGAGGSVVASNLGTETPVTVGSLTVLGKLDLNNNGLVVRNSNLSSVTAMVASGFNSGNWNGPTGIISTTAANDTTHLTALGVIVNNTDGTTPLYNQSQPLGKFEGLNPNATDVLVKYTYYGDANLTGAVDSADYALIDNGFLGYLTGWYNGDFNYDGAVNGSDYTLIDNAFNQQGASLAAQIASPTAQIAGASTAVPEPASLSLLGLGAASLLGRRRRRD